MEIRDIWHVLIMRRHKHNFLFSHISQVTGRHDKYNIPIYVCDICDARLGLEAWQMRDLPWQMQYERLKESQ